jgi:hypothetical protein
MISLIRRWMTRTNPLPVEIDRAFAGPEIADCARCGELLKVRYTLKLMSHFRTDHGMEENAAIERAVEISEAIYKRRRKV